MHKNDFDKYITEEKNTNENQKYNNINTDDPFLLTKIICTSLTKSSKEYNIESSISILKQLNGRKLIYSEISNYMYSIASDRSGNDGNEMANFTTNVDALKNKVINNLNYSDINDVVIKLYDHTQLAIHQINVFRFNKEDFEERVKNSDEINKKIESVNSQVLSLVALFTAMAFLVFGGLSSLESIFSNIKDISIVKLIVLASLWGLSIINVISIFMFFISRVIGKSFKQDVSENSTLFQRYPYLILGNFILISIFSFSSWLLLFIKKFDYSESLLSKHFWSEKNIIIFLLILIPLIFIAYLYFLFFCKRKKW